MMDPLAVSETPLSVTDNALMPAQADRQGRNPEIEDAFTQHRALTKAIKRIPAQISRLPIHSWAWFLTSMTTLGLATLINAQTGLKTFDGLYEIGLVVYLIGLCQFVILLVAKTVYFLTIRHSLRKSFDSSEESLFFATFWISCYGVITGALDFAQPHPGSTLSITLFSFFWIYLACVLLASLGMYLLLFQTHELMSKDYTPAWLLPVLPVIVVGDMAGSLVGRVHPWQLYPVLIAGLLCSSMGLLISLPMAAIYFSRLFTAGFPDPDTRPGMMIAVGPPTYAPLAYLKMAQGVPLGHAFFASHPLGPEILQTVALFLSIGIFGMAVIFVLMALLAILRRARSMSFHLTWYGFIFPNVGFFSTMGVLGLRIPSNGIIWTATVGTLLLTITWLFVTISHVGAILRRSKNSR